MVFQTYALYPHMNVRDNMGFALKLAGVSKTERERKVEEVARTLQLDKLRSQAAPALRWSASACCHRPRNGARA